MKKQLCRLIFNHMGSFLRHSDAPTPRHSEPFMGEESKNSKFFGITENKAANYGFFGRVPLPLNDGRIAQLGRSMIEMLGVLAIIGVLSIGGIALYRRAVNHHQANSILDDANRLAFVITEKGGFPANDNITNVNFEKTSTYEMSAFVGEKSGQYGIMVENVPKGVCEPLVDKAHIDYKVRVTAYGAIEYLDQDTSTGLVYDAFHKDVCINDMNDVILYFGDTSAQCNEPKDDNPCLSNAECCSGYFCYYPNNSDCSKSGTGLCKSLDDDDYLGATATVSDGRTWTRSRKVIFNWWSAQNWCTAQGLKPATRADIGCEDVPVGEDCDSDIFWAIHEKFPNLYNWFEDIGNNCHAYAVAFNTGYINNGNRKNAVFAFCR